ncbi:hypothetical protein GE061_010962 [Apolygus lucorum]|uniref:Retrotransposon gag domain-containing protein n=1 Tax=Apolygus lucorum TaxID=248454 RepID=A0A8S9XXB5_APOLU|nr:hypothetical protein GE061_010962 [Apolygus lucorum]
MDSWPVPRYTEGEDLSDFTDRLELYFVDQEISTDKQKVARLASALDASTFSKMKAFLLPKAVKECTFEECRKALMQSISPVISKPRARLQFSSLRRSPGQPLSEFVGQLKRAAAACDFGAFAETALKDRLVQGVNDNQLANVLLPLVETKTFAELTEAALLAESLRDTAALLAPPLVAAPIIRNSSNRDHPRGRRSPSPRRQDPSYVLWAETNEFVPTKDCGLEMG